MAASAHSGDPRLTVAMIVRDAERTIAASLDSIRDIADEIIVADTGSLDRTQQIAMQRATHVISVPWTDDFAAARNACLERVTGDWVLWLDAGETIAADTVAEIRRFIDEDADPAKAHLLFVRLPPPADNLAAEQVGRIRLVPNHPQLRFTGRVRESLRPALAALGMTIEPMAWCIARNAIDHDPAVKARKARRDLKLAELEVLDYGPAASALIAMGEGWSALGELRRAADCFRQALAAAGGGSTEMLEAYYGLLTTFDADSDARESQIQTCLAALEVFPFDAQLHCAIASYLQHQGRIDLASRAYRTAVDHGQVNLETWHLVAIREVAATCLSLTLEHTGDDDEARRVLEQALVIDDHSVRVRRRLIDLHIKHDRRQEALNQVTQLPEATPHREALRGAVRGACLAARKSWGPARDYLQTAYDAGCRDLICLRWLAITLVSSGEIAAAEPILRQWQAAAPQSVEAQKYLESLAAAQQESTSIVADQQMRIDPPTLSPGFYSQAANSRASTLDVQTR